MNETEVDEELLQTWMEASPEDGAISAYGRVYVPTARKDGITAYTSPARTMVRGQLAVTTKSTASATSSPTKAVGALEFRRPERQRPGLLLQLRPVR